MNTKTLTLARAVSMGLLFGLLGACTTQSGPTHTLNTVYRNDLPGNAYQVSCTGLLESAETCMKVAKDVCKDQPVTPIQQIDGYDLTRTTSDPRKMVFVCGKPNAKQQQ